MAWDPTLSSSQRSLIPAVLKYAFWDYFFQHSPTKVIPIALKWHHLGLFFSTQSRKSNPCYSEISSCGLFGLAAFEITNPKDVETLSQRLLLRIQTYEFEKYGILQEISFWGKRV